MSRCQTNRYPVEHIFLYRIHCELEERVQKGEEIPFNFECSNRFMETLKYPQGNGATESLTSISCITRREKSIQQTTITSTHLSIIPDMKKRKRQHFVFFTFFFN